MLQQGKRFFFEKKNQKTFTLFGFAVLGRVVSASRSSAQTMGRGISDPSTMHRTWLVRACGRLTMPSCPVATLVSRCGDPTHSALYAASALRRSLAARARPCCPRQRFRPAYASTPCTALNAHPRHRALYRERLPCRLDGTDTAKPSRIPQKNIQGDRAFFRTACLTQQSFSGFFFSKRTASLFATPRGLPTD